MFEISEPKKHIFNNEKYYKIYWLIPTDERLIDSLEKIKCNKKYMSMVLRNPIYRKFPYIFIGYDGSQPAIHLENRWGWCEYEGELTCDYYETEEYKFGGPINIHESELIANKYNI